MKPKQKNFYTLREVIKMNFLPFKTVTTLKKLIKQGDIMAVRNPTPRAYFYIKAEEVERLKTLKQFDIQYHKMQSKKPIVKSKKRVIHTTKKMKK